MAVERVIAGRSGSAVAKELGVHRALICRWCKNPEHPFQRPKKQEIPEPRKLTLMEELQEMKRMLAEKSLEVDFFRGALQKVEARRQRRGNSGEKTSITKSEK
jgi:transposase